MEREGWRPGPLGNRRPTVGVVAWRPFSVLFGALLTPVTLAARRTVDDMDAAARGHRPCRGQRPEQCALPIRVHNSHLVEWGKGQ